MNKKVFQEFCIWLDTFLKNELPKNIVAFNFNLYEDETSFHIQLIGASSYSKDNSDWACDEVFSTGENIFVIPKSIAGISWENGLQYSISVIKEYLNIGKHSNILKSSSAVAVGFVDGDLETLFDNTK